MPGSSWLNGWVGNRGWVCATTLTTVTGCRSLRYNVSIHLPEEHMKLASGGSTGAWHGSIIPINPVFPSQPGPHGDQTRQGYGHSSEH